MLTQLKKKIKTIGLSEDTYLILNKKRASMEIELGRKVSFDECIKILCER